MSSSAPVSDERRSPPPGATRSLGAGWWWVALGVAAGTLVALGSVVRLPLLPAWFGSHDKLTHVLAYAVLTALPMQVLRRRRERVAVAILLVAFGAGMECVQTLAPGRQFELLDMLANAGGVLLAWAALSRISKISCRRESSSNARTRAFTS